MLAITPMLVITSMLAVTLDGTNSEPIPPVESCDEIRLFAHGAAWMLFIKRDGSASLQFGSLPGDGGHAPKGTFDFAREFKVLSRNVLTGEEASALRDRINKGEFPPPLFVRVAFGKSETPEGWAVRSTQDFRTVDRIFRAAAKAIDPRFGSRLFMLMTLHNPTRPLWRRNGTTAEDVSIENCRSMLLFAENGWWLQVRRNGSGRFGFDGVASLTFPSRTIDFAETHAELTKPIVEAKTERATSVSSVIVVFERKKERFSSLLFTKDRHYVKELFEQAKAASTPTDIEVHAAPNNPLLAGHVLKDPVRDFELRWTERPPVEIKEETSSQ